MDDGTYTLQRAFISSAVRVAAAIRAKTSLAQSQWLSAGAGAILIFAGDRWSGLAAYTSCAQLAGRISIATGAVLMLSGLLWACVILSRAPFLIALNDAIKETREQMPDPPPEGIAPSILEAFIKRLPVTPGFRQDLRDAGLKHDFELLAELAHKNADRCELLLQRQMWCTVAGVSSMALGIAIA